MKSNDWGDTQEVGVNKWEDSSASSSTQSPPPRTTTTTTTTKPSSESNAALWTQEKPSPTNQTKNDWDSDAFFNDVLTTSTKPKLKTTRR
jgi:hypothetical protein